MSLTTTDSVIKPFARITPQCYHCGIPLIGGMLAVILFAMVIAAYVGVAISWGAGMIFSLKGQVQPIPLFGARSTRRRTHQATTTPETTAELIERTSTSDA